MTERWKMYPNPMTRGQLLDEVKEIIATGCGCDRYCETLGEMLAIPVHDIDYCCGCLDDAKKILDLVEKQ